MSINAREMTMRLLQVCRQARTQKFAEFETHSRKKRDEMNADAKCGKVWSRLSIVGGKAESRG